MSYFESNMLTLAVICGATAIGLLVVIGIRKLTTPKVTSEVSEL